MIYAYVRVSTDRQFTDNQKEEINIYCSSNGLLVDSWVTEIISGTIEPSKRKLGDLIKLLKPGDTLIITELSRLGRSLMMILDTLEYLRKSKIIVIAIKQNFIFSGDESDIVSKVISFAFGLSAEIERNLISERTKMGLQRAKAQGKVIGHYKGYKCQNVKLTPYHDEIKKLLNNGMSINSIAKKYGVKWVTVRNFIRDRLK